MKRWIGILAVILGSAGCAAPPAATPVIPTPTPAASHPATPTITPPTQTAAPSPDSALVLGYHNAHYELRRVDLASGQTVSSDGPLIVGDYVMDALSPDGSQLALVNYSAADNPEIGTLRLIDTRSLAELKTVRLDFAATVSLLAFSPDGRSIALAYGDSGTASPATGWRIALLDLGTGAVTAQADIPFSPTQLRFSPDGKTIAAYGVRYATAPDQPPGTPQAALLDAASLHRLWGAVIDGLKDGFYPWEGTAPPPDTYAGIEWQPATAFSADGTKLVIAHADVDRLTTLDFAARSVSTVEVSPQQSFLDRLMGFGAGVAHAKAVKGAMLNAVLSPDGKRLFVTGTVMDVSAGASGQLSFTHTPAGLKVIDVASGAVLDRLDTPAGSVGQVAARGLLLLPAYDDQGQASTQVVDAATLQVMATVPGFDVYPMPIRLADGREVMPAVQWGNYSSRLGIVDARTFALIASWDDPAGADWVIGAR